MTKNNDVSSLNTGLKLDNKLNAFSELSVLNEIESSIFFFCLLKAQDNQNTCSADELKYYIPDSAYNRSAKFLCEKASSMLRKLAKINFEYLVSIDKEKIVIDNITSLFSKYRIVKNAETNGLNEIIFTFNPELRCLIEDLRSNYTLLELRDYVTIKGKFAKRLYTLLRQFRTKGIWRVTLQNFRKVMGISDSYSYGIIKHRIINPALKELQQVNLGLKRRTIERYKKSGRPLCPEELYTKEQEGAFHLFYNLEFKDKTKLGSKSKKIEQLEFTFAPQDPKLNHEENIRRYKLKAQQPPRNKKGIPIAETKREAELKKNVETLVKDKNQLIADKIGVDHLDQNDPYSSYPAGPFRAEKMSMLAEGITHHQMEELAKVQEQDLTSSVNTQTHLQTENKSEQPSRTDTQDFQFEEEEINETKIKVPKVTSGFDISEYEVITALANGIKANDKDFLAKASDLTNNIMFHWYEQDTNNK